MKRVLVFTLLVIASLFAGKIIIHTKGQISTYDTGDIKSITFGDEEIPNPQNMIFVPAGSFTMGQVGIGYKGYAEPVHKVTITDGYYIGKYEVSNEGFCNALNNAYEDNEISVTDNNVYYRNKVIFNLSGYYNSLNICRITFDPVANCFAILNDESKNLPAVFVTWYGAVFYCNMLSKAEGLSELYNESWVCSYFGYEGYRLPTEAEWEYAARYGGDGQRTYPWGEESPNNELANFNNFIARPTAVNSYPMGKSYLEIYNMAGNVWEWCNDWYGSYSSQELTDPTGPSYGSKKMLKGGNFTDWDYDYLKSAFHYVYTPAPEINGSNIGFRVVKILKGKNIRVNEK